MYRLHLRPEEPRFRYRRTRPFAIARFRTYAKRMLQNIVLKTVRMRRPPQQLPEDVEPFVEATMMHSVDRVLVQECMYVAAAWLKQYSVLPQPKGPQRLFRVLYGAAVLGESRVKMSVDLGIHYTTASDLVAQAQNKFLEYLGQYCQVCEEYELKDPLSGSAEQIASPLQQATRLLHVATAWAWPQRGSGVKGGKSIPIRKALLARASSC